MAMLHGGWDFPEPDEFTGEIDPELDAEISRVAGNMPTGEDFFLEELYEDSCAGTMFDNYDD